MIFLQRVEVAVVTTVLGIILLAYSLYALLGPALPQLKHPSWAYGLGFLGGVLGGAYNTSGPPVIIYGTCQRWSPAEFKSNLQGFFMLVSTLAAIGHAISGGMTITVWQNYLYALPGIALGVVVGFSLDKRIKPQRFRQVILILLLIMGVRLIFN